MASNHSIWLSTSVWEEVGRHKSGKTINFMHEINAWLYTTQQIYTRTQDLHWLQLIFTHVYKIQVAKGFTLCFYTSRLVGWSRSKRPDSRLTFAMPAYRTHNKTCSRTGFMDKSYMKMRFVADILQTNMQENAILYVAPVSVLASRASFAATHTHLGT